MPQLLMHFTNPLDFLQELIEANLSEDVVIMKDVDNTVTREVRYEAIVGFDGGHYTAFCLTIPNKETELIQKLETQVAIYNEELKKRLKEANQPSRTGIRIYKGEVEFVS